MTSPTSVFVFSLLACTLIASPTVPEPLPSSARSTTEPVLIRTLLDAATSYQGHNVAVIGIAKDIEKWPPMPAGKCGIRYDSYVFKVEDESSSIRVEAMGTCRVKGVVEPVREGERVLVEGIFIQLLSGNLRSPTPFIFTSGMAIRRLPQ
jgi:hypothetical protein